MDVSSVRHLMLLKRDIDDIVTHADTFSQVDFEEIVIPDSSALG